MNGEGDLHVKREGAVCTMVIDNPAKHNALTLECLIKMAETFDRLATDDEVRTVVIRGAGEKAFSAGFDITAFGSRNDADLQSRHEKTHPFDEAMRSIRKYPYPIIAMLNGFAYGGGFELALTCDIRIAAEHVKMGMPPAKVGLVYRYDGFKRFITVLGYTRTLELFLTARSYDSAKCLEMGIVNHVVPGDELESFAYDLAHAMTQLAPLSLRHSKYILNKICEYPAISKEDLDQFDSLQMQAFMSDDHEEGKRAFIEKRKPQFKGR